MQGRDIAIIIGAIVLVILILGVLGGGMMGWGMTGPWMGWGGFGFGWWGILMVITMLLFWGLIIGGVVLLFIWLLRQGRPAEPGIGAGRSRALEILQERYAKGEITREEYEQMRRDIEGT